MKYFSLLMISVISVFLIPVIQNANAQGNNPLSGILGSLKNSIGNLTSGAGQSANQTAGQSANQTAGQSSISSNIQSNAASYPGNITDVGNNNITNKNPIGGQLQNVTKGVTSTLGNLLNGGNNTAK